MSSYYMLLLESQRRTREALEHVEQVRLLRSGREQRPSKPAITKRILFTLAIWLVGRAWSDPAQVVRRGRFEVRLVTCTLETEH